MDRLYRQYIWVAVGLLPVQQMLPLLCGAHAEESNKTILLFHGAKINKTQKTQAIFSQRN